jgi:lipid-A-disaccharide synthase
MVSLTISGRSIWMKYFFIAGERSGDLHASNLIKELRRIDFDNEVVGFGGDMMQAQGMQLLRHYKEFSFMGIWEVVRNLGTIRKVMKHCENAILAEKPDVVVLVDFPGFNLRMANFARNHGIRTCYYIAPKIWAWNKKRIKKIKSGVDKMLVIFPFEVNFFQSLDYPVEYVGNPLTDAVRTYPFEEVDLKGTSIAVLPGSRLQEVKAALPVIVRMARLRPGYTFRVAGVDNLPTGIYAALKELPNVELVFDKTYDLLKSANAAMVTSGTATLEACLINAPQVVCYRTSALTYAIGKRLIKVPFISLVNLIANKPVVKELIQHDFTAEKVLEELDKILHDHQYCATMLADYQAIKEKLGFEPASRRAARSLVDWLMPPSTD